MASRLPPTLKAIDIARFALRATQLEKMEPVISYWCNYWIVQQILSNNLHNTNDECMTYTVKLMDKLEQVKAEQGDNDAIIDDLASKAYVEQFGVETLGRAENAMNQNRVSRQTADTLHAAATFLELCQIWRHLEPDVASKIKFAKYHAVRIAKALKAGEDPNLSNPTVEPLTAEERAVIPLSDAEITQLQGGKTAENPNYASRQPSVEEVPDGHDDFDQDLAQDYSANQPVNLPSTYFHPGPPNQPGEMRHDGMPHETLPPRSEDPAHGQPWTPESRPEGDDYFPTDTQLDKGNSVSFLPEIPSRDPGTNLSSADQPMKPAETHSQPPSRFHPQGSRGPQPRSLESFPPPEMDEPSALESPPASKPKYASQPFNPPRNTPVGPMQPSYQPTRSNVQDQATAHVRSGIHAVGRPQVASPPNYVVDEEAILTAQKHAKWALSALNFEDVNTAVKELQDALKALGA